MARGHRTRASSLLGLTLGAALLFVIANTAQLMSLRLRGGPVPVSVPEAIAHVWNDGAQLVALLTAATAILAPAVFIGLRLYLLLPLSLGRLPPGVGPCLRALHFSAHWNTVSVMAVGALLALVRLADLAQAEAGPALAALCALGLVLAAIESSGLRHLWRPDPADEAAPPRTLAAATAAAATTVEPSSAGSDARAPSDRPAGRPTDPAAADARWLGCESCGWVGRAAAAVPQAAGRLDCPRCGHALEHDRRLGLQRTWALLAASAVLLLPANLLPMMSTTSALRSSEHTLLGGIAELWVAGAWGLAVLVFVASIVVPMVKVLALGLLAWSVRRAPHWRPLERARLYRLVQAIGHWSMLDVYVVVLLVGTVRFGNLAGAAPGPALLAFGAVVVLTMLATHGFDPRWIWPAGGADPSPQGPVPARAGTGAPERRWPASAPRPSRSPRPALGAPAPAAHD